MITAVHAIVFASDAEKARAFFRDVLELESVDAGGGWLIFALPPAELACHPAEGSEVRHELYLMCDDLDATMEELRGKGVEPAGERSDQGWGRARARRGAGDGPARALSAAPPVAAALAGLARHVDVAARPREVSAAGTRPEAGGAQERQDLGPPVPALAMELLRAPVSATALDEAGDPAGEDVALHATLDEHGPVLAGRPAPVLAQDSRAREVEQQQASGAQRRVDAREQARQRVARVALVEEVVEDLADREDGVAGGERLGDERADAEARLRRSATGQRDQRVGLVDAEHVVAGVGEAPGGDAGAAAEFDDRGAHGQQLQRERCRLLGHAGVARVVDVGEVLVVGGHRAPWDSARRRRK